ncbi:NADAR family protein [Dactylosporangium cerinum]|uniref:NADAR family protein n=1 Tax=Dactylosporangium cerinum TaxID=1434730 RepID=A0ABV9VST4_9ACTN
MRGFSNFSGHGFDLDGHRWTTSEHYFQAQKFPGTRHAELIRRTATPLRAAELGRDRSLPLRRDWERVKDDVMRRAATFPRDKSLRTFDLDANPHVDPTDRGLRPQPTGRTWPGDPSQLVVDKGEDLIGGG